MQFLAWEGCLDKGLKLRPMVLPDRFQNQDTQERMYLEAGLDANSIAAAALAALGREDEAAAVSRIA
jgi:1-deoxy-D-xylulose-5-phosphate synthase